LLLRHGRLPKGGFLDGADLPAELELDISANVAAADGLLARAVTSIEISGSG
jgi:hypothetical protein